MRTRNLLKVCGVIIMLWLWGCADVPPTHYYMFRPDSAPTAAAAAKYPGVLAVGSFEPDVPYQQAKIVYRTSPYEVNFYEYHQWLRPLAEMVADQALKFIAAAGLLQQVQAYTPESSSDYILRGRIKMFDFWYSEQASLVRIRIEYALFVAKTDQLLWRDTVETTAPAPNSKVVETVKGFETALQENLLQALAALERVFAQQK